jgi:hypothetical protein
LANIIAEHIDAKPLFLQILIWRIMAAAIGWKEKSHSIELTEWLLT